MVGTHADFADKFQQSERFDLSLVIHRTLSAYAGVPGTSYSFEEPGGIHHENEDLAHAKSFLAERSVLGLQHPPASLTLQRMPVLPANMLAPLTHCTYRSPCIERLITPI